MAPLRRRALETLATFIERNGAAVVAEYCSPNASAVRDVLGTLLLGLLERTIVDKEQADDGKTGGSGWAVRWP